jgi:hypothetical protein
MLFMAINGCFKIYPKSEFGKDREFLEKAKSAGRSQSRGCALTHCLRQRSLTQASEIKFPDYLKDFCQVWRELKALRVKWESVGRSGSKIPMATVCGYGIIALAVQAGTPMTAK